MMMRPTFRFARFATALIAAAVVATFSIHSAFAQLQGVGGIKPGTKEVETEVIVVKASIVPGDKADEATLTIEAELKAGWHTYSITQKDGGPVRTVIKVPESDKFKLAGDFKPDPAPEKHVYQDIYPDLELEEHHKRVTWSAPIKLSKDVAVEKLTIGGAVRAQICSDSCLPPKDYKFTATPVAKKATSVEPPKSIFDPPGPTIGSNDPLPDFGSFPGLPGLEAPGQYRPAHAHVAISGEIEPAVSKPGSVAKLKITAIPEATYHVYPLEETFSGTPGLGSATLIVPAEMSRLRSKPPVANAKPSVKEVSGLGQVSFYTQPVTWTIDIEIPADLKPGDYPINGLVGFQGCSEESCDQPQGARFDGKIAVGNRTASGNNLLQFTEDNYARVIEAAKVAADLKHPGNIGKTALASASIGTTNASTQAPEASGPVVLDLDKLRDSSKQDRSFLPVVLSGLLGGLLLNLMPCVLPVIGLKVLSFVDQSHHDRNRAFVLNVWYTLGSLAVFLVLAIVAIALRTAAEKLTLGKQFGDPRFVIPMASILFVMALSMIGIWEIPIPGFLGDRTANSLQAQEGAAGAFFKGIITTCLATPCAGPGIAVALAYASDPSTPVIGGLIVFLAIGMGMNAPYLIFGANPKLVRFLPKPGMWMETFKQAMGFVLLGTVVYLLYVVDITYAVPIFAILMALWAGCWAVGRLSITASSRKKSVTWLSALAGVAVIAAFSLTWLHGEVDARIEKIKQTAIAAALPAKGSEAIAKDDAYKPGVGLSKEKTGNELPWQAFTKKHLSEQLAAGKTVMVDFTAIWCPNCHFLENNVLNTAEVKSVVEQHQVVTLVADLDGPAENNEMLQILDNTAIPLLAIFSPSNPNKPVILRNLYTKQVLLDALNSSVVTKVGMLDR